MAKRSLVATPEGIDIATNALTGKGWSKEDLAAQVTIQGKKTTTGIGIATVKKFFSRQNVDRKYFVGICRALDSEDLKLDWRVVAGLKVAGTVPESKQSELVNPRQNHEEINVVRQIAVNLKVQIDNLYELSRYFSANNEGTLYHTNRLHEFFEITFAYILGIRNNLIDEFVLRKISIFSLEELDFIADHSRRLASSLLEVELYISKYKGLDYKSSYFELDLTPGMTHVNYLSKEIKELELYSKLQMIILCRKLRDDNELLDRYDKYKNELADDYGLIRNRIEIYEIDSGLNHCLQNIEEWFRKFELSNELESSYKRQKPEFERTKELEILKLKSIQD